MTDRELLELMVDEMKEMKHEMKVIKSETNEMKSEMGEMKSELWEMKSQMGEMKTELREMKSQTGEMKNELWEMKSEMKEMKSDIKLVKAQQSEHGEMIQSLLHASETQTAQHNALQMEVTKLSGEMRQGFADITEVQKSLIEMYGEHEVAIRSLQRRPV